MNPLAQFMFAFGSSIPILVVAVVGIVLAILRRKMHPRASALFVAGMTSLIACEISVGLLRLYTMSFNRGSQSIAAFGLRLALWAMGNSILQVAALGLITIAMFADRRGHAPNS